MPVERETLTLPVMGEIAAGQPIEAYEDAAETLAVPASMDAREDSYVLRVRGKSMIDALIDDGDFVIVQPQATARDGDIVVALLEDNGVTLKRFFREEDRIRLQPANAEMEPIYATEVQIQGKVVGVIRRSRVGPMDPARRWRRARSSTPTSTRSTRASKQLDDPSLRGKPVIVGGRPGRPRRRERRLVRGARVRRLLGDAAANRGAALPRRHLRAGSTGSVSGG